MMPVSTNVGQTTDTIKIVDAALVKSLGSNIDQQIVASSKRVLLHNIEFVPALKCHHTEMVGLKSKYIHLHSHLNMSETQPPSLKSSPIKTNSDGIPSPKVTIYPSSKVRLDWQKISKIGSGLVNLGNTCFLNSTLQCLCYTPPLANYCLTGDHSQSCTRTNFCMMCELQGHLRRVLNGGGGAIRPESILQKLHLISKTLHRGRQEDAHEFLRCIIDHLQKATLNGYGKLDRFSKATTVIDHIFSGYLRSQVRCCECKERFNTFDLFMDVGLDIKNSSSVERAFQRFVHPDILEGDNSYQCSRCKKRVRALKRFTVHRAPNVLTIQLKRFDSTKFFGKITKHIEFPDIFNLRPFMSNPQGEEVLYRLYGVLVHSGGSVHMGHYYCYVLSPSNSWYLMNDSSVQSVPQARVHMAEAYLLFYVRKSKPVSISQVTGTNRNLSTNIPQPPLQKLDINLKKLNVNLTNDLGVEVPRPKIIPTLPHMSANGQTSSFVGTKPLSASRDRISFSLKKSANDRDKTTPSLVPYGDDSDNESGENVVNITSTKYTEMEKHKQNEILPKSFYNRHSLSQSSNHPSAVQTASSKKSTTVFSLSNNSKLSKNNLKFNCNTLDNIKDTSINGKKNVILDTKLNATLSVPGNTNLSKVLSQPMDVIRPEPFKLIAKTRDTINLANSDQEKNRPVTGDPHKNQHKPKDCFKLIKSSSNLLPDASAPIATSPCLKSADIVGPDPHVPTDKINSQMKENIRKDSNYENESCNTTSDRRENFHRSKDSSKHTKSPDHDSKLVKDTTGINSHKSRSNRNSWLVEEQEYLLSPSICSNSSNASVKSTTEWKVSESDKHRHKKHKHSNHDLFHKPSKKRKSQMRDAHERSSEIKRQKTDNKYNLLGLNRKKGKKKVKSTRIRSDSESSNEYQWVERTNFDPHDPKSGSSHTVSLMSHQPIVPLEKIDGLTDSSKKLLNGPVKRWDSGPLSLGHSHEIDSVDANGCTDVVSTLKHLSTQRIKTWNGGESVVDLDDESGHERSWSDDYDEELDRGKLKKVKKNREHLQIVGNPFQRLHDSRRDSKSIFNCFPWANPRQHLPHKTHSYRVKQT